MFQYNFSSDSDRGIPIYVKKELKAVEVNTDSKFKEYVWVKINLKDKDKLLMSCISRHKSPSSDKTNYDNSNELLINDSRLEVTRAENAKSNGKTFWKYVNSKRKSISGISELHTKVNGAEFIASTDNEKAEVLADFFSGLFTLELDNPVDSSKRYCDGFSSEESRRHMEQLARICCNNHQKIFENRLDTYWIDNPMKLDYTFEYGHHTSRGTGKYNTMAEETIEKNTEEQQPLRS
ncbi:unnamed protein product [Mytilus coruscus]|uniref:Uncharacterized protein n=1 Tax=Mytilus coruscus TaxID=42192 RepID=A0A6J8D9L2_MYTCO|nr:unnamed protein product [Mytilus coruscus]